MLFLACNDRIYKKKQKEKIESVISVFYQLR